VPPLPEAFRAPVRSSLPALFVSGTLDGDAPEANATEVVAGFPEGLHLRVTGAAHVGLGFQDPGTRDAIVRFFEVGRPASLRIELPALAFERTEAVAATSVAAENPRIAAPSILSLLAGP